MIRTSVQDKLQDYSYRIIDAIFNMTGDILEAGAKYEVK